MRLIAKATANTPESPLIDDTPSPVESMENDESYFESFKDIRNNVEQIHEISQSLTAVSHEIVDELKKFLQINNRPLRLENFNEKEVVVHPNGFVLMQNKDGDTEPRLLNDVEPALLQSILKQLIPKLRDSLDDRKKSDEGLLEKLIRVRDSIS